MSEYLFSYGTLQKEDVQMEIFGRLLHGERDVLKGYKLVSIKIEDEAFLAKGEEVYQRTAIITNNNEDEVEGLVFEISDAELLMADVYEPANYKKIKVTLHSGKESWLYVAF